MVCWAVIPARLGSVRLPEKPLADLGGLPLVAHVWRRVVSTGRFDRVIVATDHDRVARVIEAEGGEVRRTGACRSGTHRVAEVAHATEVDRVVNVQGDGPMVSDAALDAVLRGLDRAPISTVCAPYLGDPQERARACRIDVRRASWENTQKIEIT